MIVYFKDYKVFYCETRILWHIKANILALAHFWEPVSPFAGAYFWDNPIYHMFILTR